jgi:hypothetical protein
MTVMAMRGERLSEEEYEYRDGPQRGDASLLCGVEIVSGPG